MDQQIFLGMRWTDVATILAIVLGPILAVGIDRFQQRWTDTKSRRLEIFRALMKTRKARLDPAHVSALNLIDLEFYGRQRVMAAFRSYIDHLSTPLPMPEGQAQFFEQREDLLLGLLHAMGDELGYSFDKHELEKLSYGPTGWNSDQNMQRQNMALLNDLLQGRRPLTVVAMQPTQQNPFPPAPEPNP